MPALKLNLALMSRAILGQVHARSTRHHKWLVALDAAAHVPTHPLNLSEVKPDFVPISFYKVGRAPRCELLGGSASLSALGWTARFGNMLHRARACQTHPHTCSPSPWPPPALHAKLTRWLDCPQVMAP
jgi:hypothetical protein